MSVKNNPQGWWCVRAGDAPRRAFEQLKKWDEQGRCRPRSRQSRLFRTAQSVFLCPFPSLVPGTGGFPLMCRVSSAGCPLRHL